VLDANPLRVLEAGTYAKGKGGKGLDEWPIRRIEYPMTKEISVGQTLAA
jgi:hypothetical protein